MPKIISGIVNKYPVLKELFRFMVVGIFCTCIDYVIYIISVKVLPYQISVILGYAISFFVNYFLTAYWTFHRKPNRNNFIGMVSCHAINLFVIRIGLITILVELFLIDKSIAYIPVIIVSSLASFLMMRFVFKHFSNNDDHM